MPAALYYRNMECSLAGAPRLAPLTVIRPRLDRWMHAFSGYPARVIAAPSGTGKTTMLLAYARSAQGQLAYCALPENCTPAAFFARLAEAIGAHDAPAGADEAIQLLARAWRGREVVIDDADNATPETIDALLYMAREGENAIVLAGRSARRLRLKEISEGGYGVVLDSSQMAFDDVEAAELAGTFGVSCAQAHVAQLLEQTDGWALAVAGALRTAQAEQTGVLHGLVLWRERSDAFLRDLIENEVARLPVFERDLFWRVYSGSMPAQASHLDDLREHGLHVLPCAARVFRLYRPLDPRFKSSAEQPPAPTPRMTVRLFRRFDAQIDGRPIPWVRRRDRQIFKYLLLAPGGRATREQLAAMFWPGTPRHKASQSVRTACSTIRKAIAAAAGTAAAEAYFRTSPDVGIVLQNVVCDVRRFNAHCDASQKAIAQNDTAQAEMHLRACTRLYAGALLEYEGVQPWYASQVQALADRYAFVLESLAAIAAQREDFAQARRLAGRARLRLANGHFLSA
ncbi:MAG TPA: AAA family ATPase [Candidatus Baltobacteraceae bacterium]|nr:AAA family ATPase [Candidatus Baltobacteraceae bacterium]